MKSLHALMALAALSVLTVCCTRTSERNDVTSRLPELPAQMAANLEPTKIDSVFMTKSPPPVQKAPTIKPLKPKQQSCVLNYDAYVIFPMTVCFPPAILTDELELANAKTQADPQGWSAASGPVRYNKLSQFRTVRFPNPLFCRVSGGPWFAQVKTTESCEDTVPDTSVLTILGAPQQLTVVWSGGITDIPPPFNADSFAFEGESCSCCGGFVSCPDGSCKPRGSSCTITPAVKSEGPPK